MEGPQIYEPLTPESLASRLGGLEALTDCLGGVADQWQVEEIGDGNLNLVFLVRGAKGAACGREARVTCAPQLQLLLRAWRRVVTAPRPLTAAAAAAAAAAEEAPLTQEQWRDFKTKERKSQRAQRRVG